MAMMDDDALFVDTNVLVYANVAEAPLHGAALHAITQAQSNGRDLWISRQVLREYLATMTRPQTFGRYRGSSCSSRFDHLADALRSPANLRA